MLAIYIIALMLIAVWGAVFLARGSLLAGCLVYLLTVVVFGHSFWNLRVGPAPLTLDRLVLAGLVICYAFRWRLGRHEPKPLSAADWALGSFGVMLLLSTLRLEWKQGLPGGEETVMRLMIGYLMPMTIYWIARQSPLGRREVGWVYAVLVGLGVYLGVTGLLEITGQWWAVFPRHIADPTLGIHFGRARGPMVHAVSYGLVLSVCLLAVWFLQARFGRWGKLALAATVPAMLAGLYFSYTRSVWLGTGLSLLIVFALTLRGSWRPLIVGGMVSAALMLALFKADSILSFEREYGAQYTRKSVDLRGSFAYVSWRMFLDRPLTGFGFDQFPEAKLTYLADRSTELDLDGIRPYSHHCTYLSVLTDMGLLGLALYLAMLAGWATAGWQLALDRQAPDWARGFAVLMLGTLGTYACQALFHELSYTSVDHTLIFLLAGVTVGLRQKTRLESRFFQRLGQPAGQLPAGDVPSGDASRGNPSEDAPPAEERPAASGTAGNSSAVS